MQSSNVAQRDLGRRLSAAEELLRGAQAGAAAAEARTGKAEAHAERLAEELAALQQMHDELQSEHTATCGQLTAAQVRGCGCGCVCVCV